MNERDFVARLLDDKPFLLQACMKVPEPVLRKMAELNKEAAAANKRGETTGDADDMGETLVEYFGPAAQAMGYDLDEATLRNEINTQMNSRGAFFKLKWTIRFGKDVNKANKQYKIK